jgi:hypothetical protein
MKFDEQGRVIWTPKELHALAVENSLRLISGFLMAKNSTPPDHQFGAGILDE